MFASQLFIYGISLYWNSRYSFLTMHLQIEFLFAYYSANIFATNSVKNIDRKRVKIFPK